MLGLNKAYFIGRVGRDPDLKTSKQGHPFASFTIAVPHRRQQEDGSWIDNPDWQRVVAFGKTAEWVTKDVHKGDAIAVECAVRQGKWTDKDGHQRYETSLVIDRLLWHSRKHGAKSPELPPMDAGSPVADLPIRVEPVTIEDEGCETEIPF